MPTKQELERVKKEYSNSNKILFGKVAEKYIKNIDSKFGTFQEALAKAIPDFFNKVFSYRQLYGFAITGSCTVPGTPPVVVPVFGAPGGIIGTSACIISFYPPSLTTSQVTVACKDQSVGFWGKIFELMGNYIANTIITVNFTQAFGLTYTIPLYSVYQTIAADWKNAGIAFGKKLIANKANDHDYIFAVWSEAIDKQIRAMTGNIALTGYPVIGALFTGTITAAWTDFNTVN